MFRIPLSHLRLGRGSFGEVFQVTQKTTGQIYAMKVLRKNKRLAFLGWSFRSWVGVIGP